MAEPDPYPQEPSRLFIVGKGFDPKFAKQEYPWMEGVEIDMQDRCRTWRANRFVPTPGFINWFNNDAPPNYAWTFDQYNPQSTRYGSFMVHGHYSMIDEITEDNPFYGKRLFSTGGNNYVASMHIVANGDESGTDYYLVGTYVGIYREVLPFTPSPNWDDGYDRGVLPGSLEGAIVNVLVNGIEYPVGLESSAFVRSQGVIGQYITSIPIDYEGPYGDTYVKSITSRDGQTSKETIMTPFPGS